MTGWGSDALLPPACLALLAALLLLARRRRLAVAALAGLVLLSVEGVARLLLASLAVPAGLHAPGPPGAIVVRAGARPGLLDPAQAEPGLETLARLRVAAALARQTGLPILLGGAGAEAMARSLQDDFETRPAWTETRSTNVWQGAAASAAILSGAGIADVFLVAQAWEVGLDAAAFKSAGLGVTPAILPHGEFGRLGLTALVAFTPAWLDSAAALRQWAGLACQAVAPCAAWMGALPTPD